MDLRGKQVFITGITSPVGREIAGLLIKAGANITGLVRKKARSRPFSHDFDIIEGDCKYAADYRKCVRSSAFVVHAAGLHLSSEIIRSCAGHDQLERIVFIGSMRAEYPDGLLSGAEKAGKRVLLGTEDEISTSLLPWTILRPTLIYSVGDRSFSKVRLFMAARHFFPLPGRGDAVRQPISAHDLAVSIIKALQAPSALRRKYSLPGEKITVREILEVMSEEMGLNVRLIGVPESPVKILKKICDLFGLERQEAALISFLRWYRGFDWPGGAAADDFGHSPRSFRQNVSEQIASEKAAQVGEKIAQKSVP